MVLPHMSPLCLSKGIITCGLHILARALLATRVNIIIPQVYGMKMPYAEVAALKQFCPPPSSHLLASFYLGRQYMLPYIPLFTINEGGKGEVLGMLGELGGGSGSVKIDFTYGRAQCVTLKMYPLLVHFVKARYISVDIPKTIRGFQTRITPVEDMLVYLHDHSQALELLTGFHHEFAVSGTTKNLEETHSVVTHFPTNAKGVPGAVVMAKRITP